jgi:hypothetical protein
MILRRWWIATLATLVPGALGAQPAAVIDLKTADGLKNACIYETKLYSDGSVICTSGEKAERVRLLCKKGSWAIGAPPLPTPCSPGS